MDLKRSLEIAKAKKGVKNKDVSEALKTSPQQVANWCRTGAIKQSSIADLSNYFEMQVSEFIALGEMD